MDIKKLLKLLVTRLGLLYVLLRTYKLNFIESVYLWFGILAPNWLIRKAVKTKNTYSSPKFKSEDEYGDETLIEVKKAYLRNYDKTTEKLLDLRVLANSNSDPVILESRPKKSSYQYKFCHVDPRVLWFFRNFDPQYQRFKDYLMKIYEMETNEQYQDQVLCVHYSEKKEDKIDNKWLLVNLRKNTVLYPTSQEYEPVIFNTIEFR